MDKAKATVAAIAPHFIDEQYQWLAISSGFKPHTALSAAGFWC
jgi:hypothetical protein